jgi:hypothetical protein
MPRDGSGIYTKPFPDVVDGTTIESAVYNGFTNDVALQLNGPIPVSAGGTGGSDAASAAATLGVVTGKAVMTYTEAEKTQARSNIYAAPLDALAYNGMQVNGSMEVSQENGTVSVSVVNTAKHAVDGWQLETAGAQTMIGVTALGAVSGAPAGFSTVLQAYPTVLNTSPAAGDYAQLTQGIEGYRTSRLGWGTANASPITISFWAASVRAGTYSIAVTNGAFNRSYAATFTLGTNVWEYKTVTIPGDTTGTWDKTNGRGMTIRFGMLTGSNYATAPNVWTASGKLGATGTSNMVSTTGDTLLLTGIVVFPGNETPSAARSPLIMRPFDQELLTCRRYYRHYGGANAYDTVAWGYAYSTAAAQIDGTFDVPMRSAPTATLAGNFNLAGATGAVLPVSGYTPVITSTHCFSVNITVASGLVAGNATKLMANADINARFKLDARL